MTHAWLGRLGLVSAALMLMGVQPFIYRGVVVPRFVLPAVVGITYDAMDVPLCTGTLITPSQVLTAGHCICDALAQGMQPRAVYVGYDALDKSDNHGFYFPIVGWRPGYECSDPEGPTGHDLAVLQLDREVADVEPMQIAAVGATGQTRNLRIAGFGATDAKGTVQDYKKREAAVDVISHACEGRASAQYGCAPGLELVAGRLLSPDTCLGDSGGPLLISGAGHAGPGSASSFKLAGVTSRGVRGVPQTCGGGGIYERLDDAARARIGELQRSLDPPRGNASAAHVRNRFPEGTT